MRFLLDESADFALSLVLLRRGHDVKSIVKDFTRSISDEDVLAIAVADDRIVITNDHDFGELVHRRSLSHCGIVLFRLGAEDQDIKTAWLELVLDLP